MEIVNTVRVGPSFEVRKRKASRFWMSAKAGILPALSSEETFGIPTHFKSEGKRVKCAL